MSPSLVNGRQMPAWAGRPHSPPPARRHRPASTPPSANSALGIQPAALIVDTIFACDGVYPDSRGFESGGAPQAGGLFIADEVQPGFGRIGTASGASSATASTPTW